MPDEVIAGFFDRAAAFAPPLFPVGTCLAIMTYDR
jgi:hypothetical protein